MSKTTEETVVMYKYMSKKYVSDFVKQGHLRVGTLYDFRKIEDSEIGDVNEGTANYNNFTDKMDLDGKYIDRLEVGGPSGILIENSEITGSIENFLVDDKINYPDNYIFCVTNIPPNKEFMEKIKYDACVRINDFNLFIKQLTKRMYDIGLIRNNSITRDCNYNGRNTNSSSVYKMTWSSPHSPYFQKEPKHAYQKEVRILMPSNNPGEIVPVNIICGDIINICTDITP